MQYTTNLSLRLPERLTDPALIADINYNMEKIDEELAAALPAVTSSDNGKFLRVVNGVWSASAIANASGGSF